MPPFLLGGLRYVTGGAILAGVLLSRGHRLPAFADWGTLAVLGFFMLLLGNGGVVWGEQVLASGLTAVLIATSPFWMVGIDALWPDGARLRVKQWLGLSIGFAGIVVLVWPDLVSSGGSGRDFIWRHGRGADRVPRLGDRVVLYTPPRDAGRRARGRGDADDLRRDVHAARGIAHR